MLVLVIIFALISVIFAFAYNGATHRYVSYLDENRKLHETVEDLRSLVYELEENWAFLTDAEEEKVLKRIRKARQKEVEALTDF